MSLSAKPAVGGGIGGDDLPHLVCTACKDRGIRWSTIDVKVAGDGQLDGGGAINITGVDGVEDGALRRKSLRASPVRVQCELREWSTVSLIDSHI